ncbi:MAG: hypothetical protein R2736_20615 [Solirubrobacterales bacterium]
MPLPPTASRCGPGASGNPGAGEAAFALSAAALRDADLDDAAGIDAYLARVGMATGGAVRVSLGLVTNLADISRFLAFASGFRDLDDDPGAPAAPGQLLTRGQLRRASQLNPRIAK